MFSTEANNYTCNHHTVHATPKEWWESISSLHFHSSHAHRVFNEIAVFSANAPHLILQPTDQFLPRCFRLPLTIIKKQQQHEKNGEKRLSVDDFLVLMLTIFSIEMLISVPTRHTWYHSPQTNFCTATSAARLLLLKSSRDTKRMVRNDWVLMIFQFFCSPFFQWNCYFQCQRATHDIAAHRPIFATLLLPPTNYYKKAAVTQKEWWERSECWLFFSSSAHLFSMKLLFLVPVCHT